jgi:uncharacterized protein (DUF433 family)
VTSEQMAMISADPAVMHGQAVIAGTRVPVSVILDCIAAGMTTGQITAEHPTVTAAGVRAAAAYRAALAREELLPIPQSRSSSSWTRTCPSRRRASWLPPGTTPTRSWASTWPAGPTRMSSPRRPQPSGS